MAPFTCSHEISVIFLACFAITCHAIQPTPAATPNNQPQIQNPIANGSDLRILPLGDSITWGEGSSSENGYRLALSNLITKNGNNLTYIGSVKSGTMANNENEGHGGFQILQVGVTGRQDYSERPNVVLFMAGTNDVVFDVDLGNAPLRLVTVIEEIATECPDAAVLVGSLTPLLNPGWMSKINDLNAKFPQIIHKFAEERGKQVVSVNMSRVTAGHIHESDGIHPTDEAYELIAAAWYEGIVEAGRKGWINSPLPRMPSNETTTQDKKPAEVHQGSKMPDALTLGGSWSLEQFLIYAVLLLGLLLTARKAAVILVRKYRH